jgi:hypothetical protein
MVREMVCCRKEGREAQLVCCCEEDLVVEGWAHVVDKGQERRDQYERVSSFGGDGNPAVIERGDSKSHIIDRPITADGVCPFRVSTTDLEAIDDVLTTYSKIL